MSNSENKTNFDENDEYVEDYEIVRFLPIYKHAKKRHLSWVKNQLKKFENPVLIDAGGGTGIMAIEIFKNFPNAKILIVDFSTRMTSLAINKGFPKKNIYHGNIEALSEIVPKEFCGQVSHILSHSVIWGLKCPRQFFEQVQKLLHKGGTFSLSTVKDVNEKDKRKFIETLEFELETLRVKGIVTQKQVNNFVKRNREIVANFNSPYSKLSIKSDLEGAGFEVIDFDQTYPLNSNTNKLTQDYFFHQILVKKP